MTKELLRRLAADAMELDISELPSDGEDLIDYGLHSVAIMQIVTHLRRQGIDASFPELFESPTIDGWWALLKKSE
ncbi:phosphopantetheine-binding protein [Streptomyces sp. NPDC001709]